MRLLVAAIGSRFRGDDEAGLIVGARLAEALDDEHEATVLLLEGEPLNLLEHLGGTEALIVVDAIASGAPAGTMHRFEVGDRPLPAALGSDSTHALSVAEALELARTLGRLPKRVVVIGLEGRDFAAGEGLSEPVAAAIDPCAAAVLDHARDLLGRPDGLP